MSTCGKHWYYKFFSSSPFFVVIDAQVSEVAKMLYQQGLTELIHSSSSEQVAYLLVERASLLEMSEVPDKLTCDGNTTSSQGTERKAPNSYTCQVRGRTSVCNLVIRDGKYDLEMTDKGFDQCAKALIV